jgi:hypothetical protein
MSDEAGILDYSDVGAAAATDTSVDTGVAAETTVVETDAAAVNTDATKEETNSDGTKKVSTKQQFNSDGSNKEEAAKTEDLPGTEKTPQDIRKALKALRDSDPAHAAAVKQLHGSFERWEAAKAIYPGGVKEMQQAKEFADLVGGVEGYEKLQGTVTAAEASDAKLYDPAQSASLIEDVVADLKAQGKLENLGSLTSAIMDAAKANNEDGFYKAFAPHFISGLELVNIPGAFSGLEKALNDPDPAKAVAAAKTISGDLNRWYKELEAENKKTKEAVVSPERKQLDKDRADFLREQNDHKTKETETFKNSVGSACEKTNNQVLGGELKDFLRMPFFKGFGKENLMPLGNTIKQNLYAALKADNAYQLQMKAMWGSKSPDRTKIEEYHKARVQSVAKDIVRDTVQKMYPGYAKGGAAAGRVAAATEKKDISGKVDAAALASGKPVYVAAKPAWDAINWEKDPKQLLYITGKAYLKAGGKLVTWRK